MKDIKLYECRHCAGTGTCSSGADSTSCKACIANNNLPFFSRKRGLRGLVCACCGGIGLSDSRTAKANNRAAPALAVMHTFGVLALVFVGLIMQVSFFSELLAFASGILGLVLGFYFSGAGRNLR